MCHHLLVGHHQLKQLQASNASLAEWAVRARKQLRSKEHLLRDLRAQVQQGKAGAARQRSKLREQMVGMREHLDALSQLGKAADAGAHSVSLTTLPDIR